MQFLDYHDLVDVSESAKSQKSHGLRSGDQGGQGSGKRRLMTRSFGKCFSGHS